MRLSMKGIPRVFPVRSYLGWRDPTRQRRSLGITFKKRQKSQPDGLKIEPDLASAVENQIPPPAPEGLQLPRLSQFFSLNSTWLPDCLRFIVGG